MGYLIAHHRTPTRVLVDRAPLIDQWRGRLTTALDIGPKRIGQIGGGKPSRPGSSTWP
jgi:superfamily II DNA or RNA helicase